VSAAVEVRKLGYRYGRSAILEDVSFSISTGTFFIIIGPNGSGKTTLMKIMAGNLRPNRGKTSILGKNIRRYSRRQLACRMAYLPQLTRLDFPMSVKDLVLMGRSPHLGMLGLESDQDHRLAENAMRYTHVLHLSGRRMDQLSGGEQQRVLIARAICQQPEIILLDEPTAALDLAHQVAVMDLMERLKLEKNITVVMISHDVNLAAMYADRLLLLKDGGILGLGPPTEVLRHEPLEAAYGCPVLVTESPLGDYLRITPVPRRFLKQPPEAHTPDPP
jgi:iron complex transport system ATP-binding protein